MSVKKINEEFSILICSDNVIVLIRNSKKISTSKVLKYL
jgi:hypothetical protein